ncbi:MAG TPA: winged helix-turn-helix domain-containing protein [Sphingomicrobium sp.]|nr:winged helix-turn-helix domain-containing protein [Sphingomicrobium sp.]
MAPIVLAHEPPFKLGRIAVTPDHRSVRATDQADREELVEPRVMQVLVALAKAGGGVLSRDDLVEACWDGRVVGDDAINRVMSRLRRLAEGVGSRSFVIETVTKVGYRLRVVSGDDQIAEALQRRPVSRRQMVAGGAAIALAGAGLAAFSWSRSDSDPPARVAPLMQQAKLALRQGTREGQTQAIGLYRQVVEIEPDYADGWAALGMAYGITSRFRPQSEGEDLRLRARAAAKRALAIDKGNGAGHAALAVAAPMIGNWLSMERELRRVLADHPRDDDALFALILIKQAVGHNVEAVILFERLAQAAPPTPLTVYTNIQALWSAGRIEETDAAINAGATLYPTHFAIWFTRFYILMSSGRADAAIALGEDRSGRPTGIPLKEFDDILAVARAARSGEAGEIDAVIATQMARARAAAGRAENAALFAALLGRMDDCFAILHAYYFGEGFIVPEVRFTAEQGTYTPRNDRRTLFLFNPMIKRVRADPRFAEITRRIGLDEYWRRSGIGPDPG